MTPARRIANLIGATIVVLVVAWGVWVFYTATGSTHQQCNDTTIQCH